VFSFVPEEKVILGPKNMEVFCTDENGSRRSKTPTGADSTAKTVVEMLKDSKKFRHLRFNTNSRPSVLQQRFVSVSLQYE